MILILYWPSFLTIMTVWFSRAYRLLTWFHTYLKRQSCHLHLGCDDVRFSCDIFFRVVCVSPQTMLEYTLLSVSYQMINGARCNVGLLEIQLTWKTEPGIASVRKNCIKRSYINTHPSKEMGNSLEHKKTRKPRPHFRGGCTSPHTHMRTHTAWR